MNARISPATVATKSAFARAVLGLVDGTAFYTRKQWGGIPERFAAGGLAMGE